MNPELSSSSMLIVMAMVLSGCGNSYSSSPSGVAATVNGEEIAVRQLRTPGYPGADKMMPTQPGPAAIEALDKLIDQELLAQKAAELRLDRDAAVARKIEAAKQKILAESYVDRSIPQQSVPQEDIVAFYRENLARFEQRRSYRLDELVATVSQEEAAQFKAAVSHSRRLDELADWLHSRNLSFRRIKSIRFSDEIPNDVHARIGTLKNEQLAIVELPGRPDTLSVIQVLQAQDAPLGLEEARPVIAKLLLEQRRQKFAQAKARQLRQSARIEYLGAFAEARNNALGGGEDARPKSSKSDNYFNKALSGLL